MGLPSTIKNDQKYTYKDYFAFPEDERWELIDGEAYCMTPAPKTLHQEILSNVHGFLWNFFQGKPCKVFPAPFDVRFPKKPDEPDEETDTVLQPDIVVICDKSKLDEAGARGAPDLVIEILSYSSTSRDFIKKRRVYERAGVKEYWIVVPWNRAVVIHRLGPSGQFDNVETIDSKTLVSPSFPDLSIPLNKIFP
ncbi:MAG: Uma2 family endonuclease [Candidatus Ozemobacteraceae bacterium]